MTMLFGSLSVLPTPAPVDPGQPPAPPPPPPSGSVPQSQDFLYTGLRDMRKDPSTGSFSYMDSYASNDDIARLRTESSPSSQATRASLVMGPFGDQRAWNTAINPDAASETGWVPADVKAVSRWPTMVYWDQVYQPDTNGGRHLNGYSGNTRIFVFDPELWYEDVDTGVWTRFAVGTGDRNGETWRPNFREFGGSRWNGSISGTGVDIRYDELTDSNGQVRRGISVRTSPDGGPDRYWVPHTYLPQAAVNPDRVRHICARVKTALIKHNPALMDDRSLFRQMFACGADWYPQSGSPQVYPGVGTSRHKLVLEQWPGWQWHVMHTKTWAGFLASYPPAG
jgi:hypothetical protein